MTTTAAAFSTRRVMAICLRVWVSVCACSSVNAIHEKHLTFVGVGHSFVQFLWVEMAVSWMGNGLLW